MADRQLTYDIFPLSGPVQRGRPPDDVREHRSDYGRYSTVRGYGSYSILSIGKTVGNYRVGTIGIATTIRFWKVYGSYSILLIDLPDDDYRLVGTIGITTIS